MNSKIEVNEIIDSSTFRRNVYNMIPENSSRILDVGCGNGALLLRLLRDKKCNDLYAVEVDEKISSNLSYFVSKLWNVDIEGDIECLREYKGYFNYVIMHDSVEHLYDPWYALQKLRPLLSDNGKFIIATPNFHYWRIQQKILNGQFPYGHGLWHVGHIRWFTPISFIELMIISGLNISDIFLEIPDLVNFNYLTHRRDVKTFQIPPIEYSGDSNCKNTYLIRYDKDIKKYYPVFYAHKLIAVCKKGDLLFGLTPMTCNCSLIEDIRKIINLPFDVYNPPAMRPLIGNWC